MPRLLSLALAYGVWPNVWINTAAAAGIAVPLVATAGAAPRTA